MKGLRGMFGGHLVSWPERAFCEWQVSSKAEEWVVPLRKGHLWRMKALWEA